jgi:glycosyltransferase involved in cell wall biosynthesis
MREKSYNCDKSDNFLSKFHKIIVLDIRPHICLLTSSRLFETSYGVEKFTISLGKWLTKHNQCVIAVGSGFASVKVKFLSKLDLQEDNVEEKKNVRMSYHTPYFIYMISRLFLSVMWIIKIISISRKTPIKLIHAQDTGYAGLAAIILGKLLKIPIVVSSHGIRHDTIDSSINGCFNKVLLKIDYSLDIFTIKNANNVVVVNSSIKDYYEQRISKRIVDVIPIPIKLENFEFSQMNRELIRKEFGIDKKAKVIGFVGRLSPEKNPLTLLNSFANAAQDDPLMKLVMVGSGPLEFQLKDYITKRGINNKVIFCGVRNDIGKVLSSFDIFVLPSYTEGLSTALLEAMACGRAIICSDIPANHGLATHNQEALFVNPHNPDELKQAISLLSNNDSLRGKLGYNAKIKASQFDEDDIFTKILKYYEGIVK